MLFRSNDTATTEIYTQFDTLSLHDALPTCPVFPALNQAGPRHVYLGGTVGQSAACLGADGICSLILQWIMFRS